MQAAVSSYADSEAGESEYWGGNIAVGQKIHADLQDLQRHVRSCGSCTGSDADYIKNADFRSLLDKGWDWLKSWL